MNVFAGKTGYIVWPQGDTGVHTCRVYDSLDEAESAARSKADFYHRAYEVRTAYENGWCVKSFQDQLEVPVRTWHGLVYLTTDGKYSSTKEQSND